MWAEMRTTGVGKLRSHLSCRRNGISSSSPRQIKAPERRRADTPAGRVIDRVGDSGRRGWPRRFAKPAPFRAAGRCKDRLDMRMLVDAEQVVGVEVGVDEATAFELKPAGPGM